MKTDLNDPSLSDEALVKLAREPNTRDEAFFALADRMSGITKTLAKGAQSGSDSFMRKTYTTEDAEANILVGLIKAVDTFDDLKGCSFRTWYYRKGRRAGDNRAQRDQPITASKSPIAFTAPSTSDGDDDGSVCLDHFTNCDKTDAEDIGVDISEKLTLLDESLREILQADAAGVPVKDIAGWYQEHETIIERKIREGYDLLKRELTHSYGDEGLDGMNRHKERVTAVREAKTGTDGLQGLIVVTYEIGEKFSQNSLWDSFEPDIRRLFPDRQDRSQVRSGLRTALQTLLKRGIVERVDRGIYRRIDVAIQTTEEKRVAKAETQTKKAKQKTGTDLLLEALASTWRPGEVFSMKNIFVAIDRSYIARCFPKRPGQYATQNSTARTVKRVDGLASAVRTALQSLIKRGAIERGEFRGTFKIVRKDVGEA